jgi:hypothetical protein
MKFDKIKTSFFLEFIKLRVDSCILIVAIFLKNVIQPPINTVGHPWTI